jgi:hypothetical protein
MGLPDELMKGQGYDEQCAGQKAAHRSLECGGMTPLYVGIQPG